MILEILKNNTARDYAAVFMDNISIYSDTEEQHGQCVRAVMDTLSAETWWLGHEASTVLNFCCPVNS
jgi:hypothetical protein